MVTTAAQLTERDTVTADGQFNLSVIMKLAAAKARREADRNIKAGYAARYQRELASALRNVWNFAQIYRGAVRTEIAYNVAHAAPAPVVMQRAA